MRSLEIIVRPAVLPDVRPAPAQPFVAPPEEDEGFVEIVGARGAAINLAQSHSSSFTRQRGRELGRTFDLMRVKQKDENGNIVPENFVDIEAVTRLRMLDARNQRAKLRLAKPEERDNVEILQENMKRNVEG